MALTLEALLTDESLRQQEFPVIKDSLFLAHAKRLEHVGRFRLGRLGSRLQRHGCRADVGRGAGWRRPAAAQREDQRAEDEVLLSQGSVAVIQKSLHSLVQLLVRALSANTCAIYWCPPGEDRLLLKESNRAVLAMSRRVGFEVDGRLPLAEPVTLLGWRP